MKIVIAPDSFKESLTAEEAARAIERGIRSAFRHKRTQILRVPLADGGRGTMRALIGGLGGKIFQARTLDPLGRKITARWGWIPFGKTAVIEMAESSGLGLIPPRKRNPMVTSSRGTGLLIRKALDHGARNLILTLGGVATNDAGAGFASALGYRFLDKDGHKIPEGAESLSRLAKIDGTQAHPALKKVRCMAITDVKNPLCGRNGSARVYGPQKGATPAMIPRIDRALGHFAKIVERDFKTNVRGLAGAGAAGGAGAGAAAFLRAKIRPGIETVLKTLHFDQKIMDADLIVTGEGKIDAQTRFGKTLSGVAAAARRKKIPIIAFCGVLDLTPKNLRSLGLQAAYPIAQGKISRTKAMKRAASLLEARVRDVFAEQIKNGGKIFMKQARVLITRPIPEAGILKLKKAGIRFEISLKPEGLGRKRLMEKVRGRTGILCLLTEIFDKKLMDAAGKSLKVISNHAVGYDNIDVAEATRRGILVTNTPGVLTETTAEMAWALLFAAARRVAEADRYTRSGQFKFWNPLLFHGQNVSGKTLGIIGAGRIGSAFARMAKGFDMDILYASPRRNAEMENKRNARKTDLRTLLRKSDFVSIHAPLKSSTRHLIGEKELRSMKKTAVLVNTSRGPLIDERALVSALKAKRIAAAGLDVYEREPELAPGLKSLPNVVLAPHIASATWETRNKMAELAVENLIAALSGKRPAHCVNPEAFPC